MRRAAEASDDRYGAAKRMRGSGASERSVEGRSERRARDETRSSLDNERKRGEGERAIRGTQRRR